MKYYLDDLCKAIAKDTGFYREDIEEVFKSMIKVIPNMIKNEGDQLLTTKFGIFSNKERKGREVINPRTFERMSWDSRKRLCFKSSEVINCQLN